MYHGIITDAHIHFWDLEKGHYPWLQEKNSLMETVLGNYDAIRHTASLSSYLPMAHRRHHIECAVHIEAGADPKYALIETQWLQKQADTFGFPHGIVAYADFSHSDSEDVLKDQLQFPNVRGVRQRLIYPKDSSHPNLLLDKAWRKHFSLLSKYRLSFDLNIFSHQLNQAASLAKEYDDIPIILDHMGIPCDSTETEYKNWEEGLQIFAACPNTYCKLSGIGLASKIFNKEKAAKLLLKAVDTFGPERCLFGSHFPINSLFLDFDSLIEKAKETLSRLDDTEQRKIFYETAKKAYNL